MLRRALFLFLLNVGFNTFAASAQATEANTSQEGFVIEQRAVHLRFENDGTGTEQTTAVVRIQSEAGVQQFGQLVIGYTSATEKLEVNYVRVRKPGGGTVETPSSNAQDFAPEVIKAVPMYSDYRERHVTVVGLRPGDVLEYRTTTHTVLPVAAGQFWFEHTFLKDVPVTEDLLQIEVPTGRALRLKSPNHKYEIAEIGGYRTYSWMVRNIVPDRKKKDSAETERGDAVPDVQLTTFKDWEEVAHWYGKLQGHQVVVSDAVRSKAVELTQNAATPPEKIRRLYDYVAREFRYVSLSFGVGRYEPHEAPEVLQAGYGDCKDKHTLLAALLRAAGIQSYPVLINSSRKLDPDVPSPAQFDHVITAVQTGGELLWLDSTTGVAPFGLITYSLRNKQALLASEGPTAGLKRTPVSSPVKNSLMVSMDGQLTETGGIDTVVDLTASGDSDLPLRLAFRSVPEAEWQRLLELVSFGWGREGEISDISVGPLEDTNKPFHIRFRQRQDKYLLVPNADGRLLPFPPIRLPKLKPLKGVEPLDVGPAMEVVQRTHFVFAANYTVRIPTQISTSREYGEYSSKFRLTNNVLDAERRFVLKINEVPASRRTEIESLWSVASNDAAQTVSCVIRAPMTVAKSPSVTNMPVGELHKAGLKALNGSPSPSAQMELLSRFATARRSIFGIHTRPTR